MPLLYISVRGVHVRGGGGGCPVTIFYSYFTDKYSSFIFILLINIIKVSEPYLDYV